MQQTIEGGGVLNSLMQMFFKGVDKLLDSAAEYEEEMGVLKQINRIPIFDKNGKEYILTIKLAPIKNKSGYYYVEAESQAPGLDLSSVNGKVMQINNKNVNRFNEIIEEILSEKGMEVNTEEQSSDSTPSEGQEGQQSEQSDITPEQEVQIVDIGNEVKETLMSDPLLANYGKEIVSIERTIVDEGKLSEYKLKIHVISSTTGGPIEECPDKTYSLESRDENGNVKSFETIYLDVQDKVRDYMREYGITPGTGTASLNSSVKATFIREKNTKGIKLTAITASCDISSAWDIVQDVMDDDEFAELITEEPQSFEITESDPGCYEIEQIEVDIDTSDSYTILFESMLNLVQELDYLRWATGVKTWSTDSFVCDVKWILQDMLDEIAIWVVAHLGQFKVPQLTIDENLINSCTNETQSISQQAVHARLEEKLNNLIDLIDDLYVNFERAEQARLDGYVASINNNLTYADQDSWN